MSAPSKQGRQGATPSRPRTQIDRNLVTRHLTWLHRPEFGPFEIRLPGAHEDRYTRSIVKSIRQSSILIGYYDNVHDAVVDLSHLEGVSAYACYNPVDPRLIHRVCNRLASGIPATKDEDIITQSTFYIDFDSDRPEEISASDDELKRALDQFARMLDDHPTIRDAAHWGCSGNGSWGGVDIVPMEPAAAYPHVQKILNYLAHRYTIPGHVKVGSECKNPSRVGCVAGTYKCKGEGIGDRPWRMVTMDSPDRPTRPLDLAEFADELPDSPKLPRRGGVATGNGHHAAPVPPDDREIRIKRAEAYAATKDVSIQGNKGSRNIRSICTDIIWGFDLSIDEARPIIERWNQGCRPPWSQIELEHAMKRGDEVEEYGNPRGYKLAERQDDYRPRKEPDVPIPDCTGVVIDAGECDPQANGQAPPPPAGEREDQDQDQKPKRKLLGNESPDDPHRLARVYLNSECRHGDHPTIKFHRESWMKWNGQHYDEIPAKELNAALNRIAKDEFTAQNHDDIEEWSKRGKKNLAGKRCPMPTVRHVGTRTVGDISQALTSYTVLDGKVEAPSWIGTGTYHDPLEMLPCKNGLIHLPSYVSGSDYFAEPTPLFFGTYSLGYDFDPDVPEPCEWLKFLRLIWEDDVQTIGTLQEWFGYCLTPDNRQQKILMLCGPKRGGKDTIGNILQAMIGDANSTGNTLNSFAERFGISSMIGKPLTVVGDARLSSRADLAVIVERLLTISGGGKLTIDRKNKSAWTGVLNTRIVINTNELPRFTDSSGAFASRLLILRLTKSFYGKEDTELLGRLKRELPGILLWAIEGWRRLKERGRFVQPESGADLVREMIELSSPVCAFVEEKCIVAPECSVEVQDLYAAWRDWCKEEAGRRDPGTSQTFGRDLRAVIPHLEIVQPRQGEARIRKYRGIELVRPRIKPSDVTLPNEPNYAENDPKFDDSRPPF